MNLRDAINNKEVQSQFFVCFVYFVVNKWNES